MRQHALPDRQHDLAALAGFLTLCLAVGGLAGWATSTTVDGWYRTLAKPSFAPPGWLFPPVWTVLYLLMATAAWRIWRLPANPARGRALALFALQLALNLIWSFLFFTFRSPPAGLADIAVLWVAIVATLRAFGRLDRAAGLLLLPYLLWVGYAVALNLATVWLN